MGGATGICNSLSNVHIYIELDLHAVCIESFDFACLYYLPFAFILCNMTLTTAALHFIFEFI